VNSRAKTFPENKYVKCSSDADVEGGGEFTISSVEDFIN